MREKKKPIFFCSRISISLIAALLLLMATFPVASAKGVVTSCNSTGFEINQFAPGENVSVTATGLGMKKDYEIWIQDDPVNEGDTLNTSEDPSGAQETVPTDKEGSFGPILIWAIPDDAEVTYHKYDIVVDRPGGGCMDEDEYNPSTDGLDSATVAGITAPVPDVSALILFASGLVLVLVYLDYGRRRKNEVLK